MLDMSSGSRDGRARLVKLTRAGPARLLAVLPGYYQVIDAFMQKQEFAP
jgi:hypothetical protein